MASPEGSLVRQLRLARVEGGACRLSPRVIVRVSGGDAFRYLNGQVTRDLTRLHQGEALPACLLNPKGKLCVPAFVSREGEDLLVETDPLLEEALMVRLARYIVADDVMLSIDPVRDVIHHFGARADNDNGMEGVRVVRLGVPGRDVDCKATHGELIDPRVVETLRIERGIPRWGSEMNEETLPPEVGLDRTHIDYDRGCYPGQETVSRLKSIGRVNRLLHTLQSPVGVPLGAGMHVVDPENREIGMLGSASEQFDTGAWVALAILPRETKKPLFARDPLTETTTPLSIVKIHGS